MASLLSQADVQTEAVKDAVGWSPAWLLPLALHAVQGDFPCYITSLTLSWGVCSLGG